MSTSNAALLTRSHTVYSAKKRAKNAQIQQVVFDDEARREYLTGFQKRNILKKEAKRKHAKERERLEKLELRKQHRRELAERAAQNVKEVEGALGLLPEDVRSEPVNQSQAIEPQEEELEFEDEEQLAVVTVIEDFTTESLMHPAPKPTATTGSPDPVPATSRLSNFKDNKVRVKKALKVTSKSKPKAATSRFHYETKAGRNAERTKQRARRTEKAERAGGRRKKVPKR